MTRALVVGIVVLVIVTILGPSPAWADENYGTPLTVWFPSVSDGVPSVLSVPGKEYSDSVDITTTATPHSAQIGQVVLFRGDGTVKDAPLGRFLDSHGDAGIVDAQANGFDALYSEVVNNQVPLVFSVTGDTYQNAAGCPIIWENTTGAHGLWATSSQVVHQHYGQGLADLDSLEIWVESPPWTEGVDADTNWFSLAGDSEGGCVYSWNGIAGSIAYTQTDIKNAIGYAGLASFIDLDALMKYGDRILFSIEPISELGVPVYDGGEIWEWSGVLGQSATFLNHGGHLWDTAFDVMGTFGTLNENIDALEAVAVPEPTSLLLLVGGLCGIAVRRIRRTIA